MDKARPLHLQLRSFFAEARSPFPVALAYLFGSQATGRAGAQSDCDLAVLFDCKVTSDDRYLLAHQLTELLDRDVDLVDLACAPVELVYNVIATGQILYEKDRTTRVEFKARALGLYFAQLPTLREQRRSLLEETWEDYDAGVERYRTALRATERMLAQTRAAQEQVMSLLENHGR
jgi:predicted nucleotidyltransferase